MKGEMGLCLLGELAHVVVLCGGGVDGCDECREVGGVICCVVGSVMVGWEVGEVDG